MALGTRWWHFGHVCQVTIGFDVHMSIAYADCMQYLAHLCGTKSTSLPPILPYGRLEAMMSLKAWML